MISIERLDLAARADEAAEVQAAALGPVAADRALVFARHAGYPGFRAFGAFDGARLLGFAYGARCLSGQWWYDQIRPTLVESGYGAWAFDPYSVTELHVRPDRHGRGLGLELLIRLLADVAQPTALLSTYDVESRARRLYRGLGFVDLVTGFHFGAQAQRYALMAATLPLPAVSRAPAGSDPGAAAEHA